MKDNVSKSKSESEIEDDGDADADHPPPSSPPSLRKLLGLARPEATALGVALFFMVIAEASGLLTPLIVARAYDALVDPSLDSSERMQAISRAMSLALLLHAGGMVCGFLRSALMAVSGERVVARVRQRLFGAILRQEIAFFDTHKSGELVSRLGSDATLLNQATSMAVPEITLGVTKLATCLGICFWISPALAGVTVGLVAGIFVACIPFGKKLGALSKTYQDALGRAQTRSTEALGGMRTVQAFAAEDRERRRYQEAIGDPDAGWVPAKQAKLSAPTTYGVGFSKSVWTAAFYTLLFGFGFGAMYIAQWYGFKLVIDGNISLGELTAFQSYIFQIGGSLGSMSRFVTQFIEARGASGRIFHLLERVPAIPSPWPGGGDKSTGEKRGFRGETEATSEGTGDLEKGGETAALELPSLRPPSMRGDVQFRDVDFTYPSRPDVPVLRGLSLRVPPDTTCAFVGSSGAGKSTAVALLQRFYDVNDGSITIDGHDVRALDLKWLRTHMGYVQQEPQMFGMTIRENVSYGVDRDVTEKEIEDVCREANAFDFVDAWPDKFDTIVGERGITLSGGQKQRLSIARALLVNPRILLLDEATSALDSESEHLVQEAIDKAMVGRTVIIVAHRLSTVKDSDQIVCLDGQQIAGIGTHEELLLGCSKYQDLIRRQTAVSPDETSRGDVPTLQ